ncbi:MAG: tripartite tricarboxylate transporter substrate-binding protein [Pigmentiphaga sp.]
MGHVAYKACSPAGFDNFEAEVWFGVLAPSGTPEAVVQRLREAIRHAVASENVQEKLRGRSFHLDLRDSQMFNCYIADDFAKWKVLVREAKTNIAPWGFLSWERPAIKKSGPWSPLFHQAVAAGRVPW